MTSAPRPFPEAELSRLAERAVVEHGVEAPTVARLRAAERLGALDLEGAHCWCVIGRRADLILGRMSHARH